MTPSLTYLHLQADSFQSDIFPDAPSIEPSLSASEFFNGKTAPANYISLADGSSVAGSKPTSLPPLATPTATQPTRTFSASAPSPAPAPEPVRSFVPAPEPTPATPRTTSPVVERSSTSSNYEAVRGPSERPRLLQY
jgi:coronin-1B/1C/6